MYIQIKKALNWMMTAMVNAKMSELPPPLMQETSSKLQYLITDPKKNMKINKLHLLIIYGMTHLIVFAWFLICYFSIIIRS